MDFVGELFLCFLEFFQRLAHAASEFGQLLGTEERMAALWEYARESADLRSILGRVKRSALLERKQPFRTLLRDTLSRSVSRRFCF